MRSNPRPCFGWLVVTCCALLAAQSETATATTILDNSDWTGTLISLGEYPPETVVADQYWAQTFTTPATDTRMRSLRFPIRNSTESPSFGVRVDGDLNLRILLTEFSLDNNGFHPGTILFESDPQTIPYIPPFTPLEQLEFTLPDVALEPLSQYAFILDAFTDQDFGNDVYPRGSVATANGYDGGAFYSAIAPPDENGMPTGTREDHLAGQWGSFSPNLNIDMAFTITFVPEPSTAGLAGCGLLLLGAWRCRRLRRPVCRQLPTRHGATPTAF